MNQQACVSTDREQASPAPVRLRLVHFPAVQPAARRRLAGLRPAALFWGMLCFALGQALLSLNLYQWHPEWRDPEYGQRLLALKKRIADYPGRPLVVVLGSSRMAMGFRPDALADSGDPATSPIVFNFSLLGAGPIMELLCLDRLLAEGIRPDWVFVECWAPFWLEAWPYGEEDRFDPSRFSWRDRPLLERYYRDPAGLSKHFLQGQLLPIFSHRFTLLSQLTPGTLNWSSRRESAWDGIDSLGWMARFTSNSTRESASQVVEYYRSYFGPILRDLKVSGLADQAMRELLTRCRHEGIRAGFVYLPEGKEFQSWYPAAVLDRTKSHLQELSKEYAVPVIFAREWMQDADFADSSHLLPASAAAFTRRFGEEVLQPLLAKRN